MTRTQSALAATRLRPTGGGGGAEPPAEPVAIHVADVTVAGGTNCTSANTQDMVMDVGDIIVVIANHNGGNVVALVPSCTGVTWTAMKASAGWYQDWGVWYGVVTEAGTKPVTISAGAGTNTLAAIAWRVVGGDTTNVLDGSATVSGELNGQTMTLGNRTTTLDGSLVFFTMMQGNSGDTTYDATASWRLAVKGVGGSRTAGVHKVMPNAGATGNVAVIKTGWDVGYSCHFAIRAAA